MADLVSVFEATAARMGDDPALIAPGESIGFAKLAQRAEAFAATCARRGVGRGDRIIVAMPVGVDLFVALAGAWRLGAVVVFPEPAMGLTGFLHALRTTKPTAFFASGAYCWLKPILPWLWRCTMFTPRATDNGQIAPVALGSADPALISFTSGSTGVPKAIMRSHGFLMAQYAAVAPLLASDRPETDLVAFPVFTLINLADGRCSVLPNWRISRPDKVKARDLAAWIAGTGVTRALLPPALCEALSGANIPDSLHTVFTGGGPVSPRLVTQLHAQKAGLRVVSVYGSTEAEPIADLDWADVDEAAMHAMKTGAGLLAGVPVTAVQVRIVDDEIQVAGAHVNDGYLDPAMDAGTKLHEGGVTWHRTGDAGRLDADGRLWLLGRTSAIARRGTRRIYPFALEVAAQSLPGIRRAALWHSEDEITLVIEGTDFDTVEIMRLATENGLDGVRVLDKIPMDRRHGSKVDYTALTRRMG